MDKKIGRKLRNNKNSTSKLPNTVLLDETVIKQNGENFYVYAVLDPETRRVLHLNGYTAGNIMHTENFFQELEKEYGEPPKEVITDNASYYSEAFRRLGINWKIIHKDIRNRVER